MREVDAGHLKSVITGHPKPILLLGAGASVTSGVPLVHTLIDMMGKQGYCWSVNKDFEDETVMRSDWWPWVRGQPWYRATDDMATQYGDHIENILQPRARRREFFQKQVLRHPKGGNAGYRALASLVGKRRIHTVLTTNFDTLAYDSCRSDMSAAGVLQIQSPVQAEHISTDPGVSQVVHVHGVVDHYTDLNLASEVAHVADEYAERLVPMIRDHPLIVVGYRGAEPSISRDLLLAAARLAPSALPHGVYWCHRDGDEGLHPLVTDLAEACGRNFSRVRIAGFDELLVALDDGVPRLESLDATVPTTYDCEPSASHVESLDLRRVETTLKPEAAERLALHPISDKAEAADLLRAFGLISETQTGPVVSRAAHLLFGTDGAVRASGHMHGHAFDVSGNIFDVYEDLSRLVTEVNSPYRVKGPESVEVRPFNQLAVKELLVNCLAHRDYAADQDVELVISDECMRLINPGGLENPDNADQLGNVDIRNYRNPLIAEVLYASGLMDKLGSGLVDVRKWAWEGGANVEFKVDGDNSRFEVVLESRPDSQDGDGVVPEGSYEVFYLNALPASPPAIVWVGASRVRGPKQIFDAHRGERVPPFVLDGRTLISFSDLTDRDNPLRQNVEAPEAHGLDDYCSDPAQERKVVELLNRSFQRHLDNKGLQVWAKRQRAWFTVDEDGEDVRITYQARTRAAQRTVARLKKADSKYPYYEHQAINWAFVRSGGEWLLAVEPTWTFTQDGRFRLVGRRRHGRLAASKMGNERNRAVLNHVFFWSWVVCGENRSVVLEDGGAGITIEREPLTRHQAGLAPLIGTGSDDPEDPPDVEDVDDDLELDEVDPTDEPETVEEDSDAD